MKARRRSRGPDSTRRREPPHWLAPSFVLSLGVALVLPCYGFGWLWDDFDFIGRAQRFRLAYLLPDPGTVFYRPLSREIYFGLIWPLGHGSIFAAHVGATALFVGIIALLMSIGTRLAGRPAGILAGILFASLGAAPLLVGWASGVQDLLAILFALLALRWSIEGRILPAAAVTVAALLSKETALALLPVVALTPWILGIRGRPGIRDLLPYGFALVFWIAVHPASRALVVGGSGAAESSYLGWGTQGRIPFAFSTLLSMLNLPPPRIPTQVLPGRLQAAVVALVLAIGAIASMGDVRRAASKQLSVTRVALWGALVAAFPFVLTVAVIRLWAPYYAVLPAIGSSLALGALMTRFPKVVVFVAVAGFLALGVLARGMAPDPSVTCERNFQTGTQSLSRVEAGFKSLYPTMPSYTTALVSVASTGSRSIGVHLHRFQALRVWYQDPSIVTLPPEQRRPGHGSEMLFRITNGLDVVEIDTERCRYRSSGARPLPTEVQRPARTYARALAVTEPERAARLQRQIAGFDLGELRYYDLRLAAMYLYAAGRTSEALLLLDSLPGYPKPASLDLIAKLYKDPTPGFVAERFALPAFGIADEDVEGNRYLMRKLWSEHYEEGAAHFARKLERLDPTDAEARRVVQAAANRQRPQRITTPVEAGE